LDSPVLGQLLKTLRQAWVSARSQVELEWIALRPGQFPKPGRLNAIVDVRQLLWQFGKYAFDVSHLDLSNPSVFLNDM
jgi:hypothetical protein